MKASMSDRSVPMMSFHPSVRVTLRFVMRVRPWRSGPLAACTLACLLSLPVFAQQAEPAKPARSKDAPVSKDPPAVVQPGAPGQPTRVLPSSTRATLPPPSPADVQFMQHMIVHHAQAMEMTALIESHTQNKVLRTLGERISRSQSDEIKFMKRWLEARGKPTAMAMHEMHGKPRINADGRGSEMDMAGGHMLMPGMLTSKQMEELRKSKGKEFDRLFLSGMIQHHNGALIMVRNLFDTPGAGEDAELFNFATDVDSGQRAEIRVMEKILEG